MRIEELANSNFIKGTDNVERYLLEIIRRYFSSNGIDDDSRDYIINKAVEQMKQELDIDNAGVISINGQTGEVNITLSDLGGEPEISPKLSAFNVNFGNTENTACVGNDPRLSDARKPLPHTHSISDINGLDGEISAIKNSINMLGVKTHSHDNLDVLKLLTYSGTSTELDLTVLDNASKTLNTQINTNQQTIDNIVISLNNLITDITNELNQYNADYNNIKTYIKEQDDLLEVKLKDYYDNLITVKENDLNTIYDSKISKDDVKDLLNSINNQYHALYDTNISNFIVSNNDLMEFTLTLPSNIIDVLNATPDYKIDFTIQYTDPTSGKSIKTNLPFVYAEGGVLSHTIKGELINNSVIRIVSSKASSAIWSSFINAANINVKIYVKNNLEV